MKKCTAIVGVTILAAAWTATAQETPKFETFLGYEYVRFNSDSFVPAFPNGFGGQLAFNPIPAFSANGGGGQFAVNVSSMFGIVFDIGATHNGNVGGFQFDNTAVNFLAGPRFSIRRWGRVRPYFQLLLGGVYATTSAQIQGVEVVNPLDFTPVGISGIVTPGQQITARVVASTTHFGMTLGGGLDIRLSKHVAFRPIGLDWFVTNFNHNYQDNLRYSVGFNFMFGGEKAPPPPPAMKPCPNGTQVPADATCPKMDFTVSLNANPTEVCSGENVQVTAVANGVQPNQVAYNWSVNGSQVSTSPTLDFSTANRDAGTYTVTLAATAGDDFNPASASTTFTVREYRPPMGTVSANPSVLRIGDKSALSSSFQGQCGGPIQPATYEASEGSVQGDQFDCSTVQFDANSSTEQRKTITITAKASDRRSLGTATTTVECVKAASATPVRLPDVLFADDNARVNNCGKRILLEQLKAYIERDPTGQVVLVGHNSANEKEAALAIKRTMNSAAVIVAGTGVCLSIPQSQVQLSAPGVNQNGVGYESGFCSSSVPGGTTSAGEMRRVEVWFIPTGAQIPASVMNSQSAAALNVSTLGCPK